MREIDDDCARRIDSRPLAGARELRLIREPIHDFLAGEGQRIVTRERIHVARHERRENVVVRHQDELLVRVAPRDRHESVKQLSIGRVSAHVVDIKKV